ncbi:MAG: hypothetical protein EZS28_036207 [Streblomastix strix]|uniref:Uncharacterized protein n=1 Tax=Streblomastix strix TaxID=222440 RepID=A0A5J4UCM1_9EUKA|nr:MAG: hypothetical protein EZS28_036207 [Streblomastix strix]
MIMTVIIDMRKIVTIETNSQIWEEVGREKEQFQEKVRSIDRVMMIGLRIYTARSKDNNQDNLGYDAIDENKFYLQSKQFQEHQSTCQVSEQFKKKSSARQITFLLTLMKKALYLGQVQNQSIKKGIHQSQISEQPNNYSLHKIIKNNQINK